MLGLLRNKKAQTTAEYAILIGLVVAALVAMQTYVKRGLQGRIRDFSDTFTRETATASGSGITVNIGNTFQYEPYYLSQNTTTNADTSASEVTSRGGALNRQLNASSNRTTNQQYGW